MVSNTFLALLYLSNTFFMLSFCFLTLPSQSCLFLLLPNKVWMLVTCGRWAAVLHCFLSFLYAPWLCFRCAVLCFFFRASLQPACRVLCCCGFWKELEPPRRWLLATCLYPARMNITELEALDLKERNMPSGPDRTLCLGAPITCHNILFRHSRLLSNSDVRKVQGNLDILHWWPPRSQWPHVFAPAHSKSK